MQRVPGRDNIQSIIPILLYCADIEIQVFMELVVVAFRDMTHGNKIPTSIAQ